jgi:CheY-like chemotaxis protein
LAISRSIVQLFGGDISVSSTVGSGSEFSFEIWLGLSEEILGEHKEEWDTEVSGRFKGKKALLVDDVDINRMIVITLLEDTGLEIDEAVDGSEAIKLFSKSTENSYDIILMDIQMPVMDGFEATMAIRRLGRADSKTVPIIALTANAIVGNEEMFLSKGFQAFLTKPIDVVRLDSVIRQWVRDDRYEIDGLYIDKGIERFSGDKDTYFDILRSFVINASAALESIQEVDRDNLSRYTIIVHGIKGSSRNICAESVGDLAEVLEKAAKAGDYDFIVANNPPFLEVAWKLVLAINNIFTKIDSGNPKPKKDKPDVEMLKDLLEACQNYDMDSIDFAAKELGSYEYESGGELVAEILESVSKFDMNAVVKRLSDL